jgi:arabinogalactan oligomer/maltooligosaccharide transport system permease protein
VLAALVVMPFVTGAAVSLFVHHQGDWTFVGLHNFLDILLRRDWPITSPAVVLVHPGGHAAVDRRQRGAARGASAWRWRSCCGSRGWRLRPLWRALLILPWAIPNYITALIWKACSTPSTARSTAISARPGSAGPVELDWFASFSTAFSANLVTNTWLGFPFMMVVTLGRAAGHPARAGGGGRGGRRHRLAALPPRHLAAAQARAAAGGGDGQRVDLQHVQRRLPGERR